MTLEASLSMCGLHSASVEVCEAQRESGKNQPYIANNSLLTINFEGPTCTTSCNSIHPLSHRFGHARKIAYINIHA